MSCYKDLTLQLGFPGLEKTKTFLGRADGQEPGGREGGTLDLCLYSSGRRADLLQGKLAVLGGREAYVGLKESWPPDSAYSPFFIPPSPHGSLGAKQRLYWQSSENASKQVPTQKAETAWETVQAQTCSRGLEPSPDTPTPAQAAVSHVVRVPVRRMLGTSSPVQVGPGAFPAA